ncbi:MAG: O-antigen ligase family protein [Candidatus Gastranaerophilales bacterium]|nr:O-antigen ligase family protein [Candidatus Gastranaerophilales bacterium]
MKFLESKIFDGINSILSFFQNKLAIIANNSLLLLNLDFFILISIIATYIVSTFAQTNLIGLVSFCVPVFVVAKVLLTKGEKIELEKCNFYLLMYLIICFITNFTSSMPFQSLYGFMKTLIYFAFYFALCQFLKNNKKYIILLLFVIAILISFESIIGLIQNSVRVENISTWQDTSYVNPEHVLSRVYGTLQPFNPNLLGGYLIVGISSILAVASFLFHKGKIKSGIISLLCFLVSTLAIFLTGCRGAYLALFVMIIGLVLASYQVIYYNFKNIKLQSLWKTLIAFCGVGGVFFMFLNQGIFRRLMSIFILRGDSSTSFRMNVYNSAIQMFQDNWLCGIGVGNKVFREIYGLYMLSGFDALSCYCVFLEMAVESGIFALIAYLLFVGSLLTIAVKKFLNSDNLQYKVLLFVTFISIVSVMFHGLFDTIYFRPQIQYIFWTMAAILTVLVREEKAE